jgi:hypothetical protein
MMARPDGAEQALWSSANLRWCELVGDARSRARVANSDPARGPTLFNSVACRAAANGGDCEPL